MSGGWADEAYDEILEFRPDTEDWSLAGRMLEARSRHAVSTINFGDVYPYCDNNFGCSGEQASGSFSLFSGLGV